MVSSSPLRRSRAQLDSPSDDTASPSRIQQSSPRSINPGKVLNQSTLLRDPYPSNTRSVQPEQYSRRQSGTSPAAENNDWWIPAPNAGNLSAIDPTSANPAQHLPPATPASVFEVEDDYVDHDVRSIFRDEPDVAEDVLRIAGVSQRRRARATAPTTERGIVPTQDISLCRQD